MPLDILAFLGGALTIISPCILPVLPFVFARPGRSFARSTLPLLIGMALTFALIATLAAVGGAWAFRVNSWARTLALVFLFVFGVALLSKRVADWISRPFVALGNRLVAAGGESGSIAASLTLGVATGLLWAPCAGPILGLILTGAAINGPSAQTTTLLFAYAAGAATSLALATLAGNRIFRAMKLSLGATEWLRRGLGVAVLVAIVAILNGWDTGLLTRISFASTNHLEQALIDRLHPNRSDAPDAAMRGRMGGEGAGGAMTGGAMRSSATTAEGAMTGGAMTGGAMTGGAMSGAMTGGAMNGSAMTGNAMSGAMTGGAQRRGAPVGDEPLPPLTGAGPWLNSAPLSVESLHGKVVMIDFWTYSCINCLRTLPYLRTWQERYSKVGFTIVGIHTPEFAFEKDPKNVERAVRNLGVTWPVALDNDYAVWRAFGNEYWPAHYFVDAQGKIRSHHFGEGGYDESEQTIRALLTEAGVTNLPAPSAALKGKGIELAANEDDVSSPETYIGYERAQNFASPGKPAPDVAQDYAFPGAFQLNDWALKGKWTVSAESAVLDAPNGQIAFRFHARDLHLVLGPGRDGKPIRFRVRVDGRAPGESRGVDVNASGEGVVREQRLYQLIRQQGPVTDQTFTIEFLDAGAQAWSFTFG